jgi:hypothetical protein
MADGLAARWDFLRPWCAPVRGKLFPSAKMRFGVPDRVYVGVALVLPSDEDEVTTKLMRATRDALLLLSMVAHVDRQGWRYVLEAHCGVASSQWDRNMESAGFAHAPFMFPQDERGAAESAWVSNMLLAFFAESDAPVDAYFAETVRQIANNMPRRLPALKRVEVPMMVTVNSSCDGLTPHPEHIYRVLQAFKVQHNGWRVPIRVSNRAASDIECTFVLRPIQVELLAGWVTPSAPNMLGAMTAGANDVPISSISVVAHLDPDVPAEYTPGAQIVGHALERLLCATGVPEGERVMLDEIHLVCMLHQAGSISRLASAIAETRTTRFLRLDFEDLNGNDDLDARTWELLAYALFSRHTRSVVTHVSMSDITMTAWCADAVAAVLASDDPVKHLFGRQPRGIGDEDASEQYQHRASHVMLQRGSTVTIQQMHPNESIPAESAAWTLATDVPGVRLVDDGDEPMVRVLLPGYGLCTAPQDQVVELLDVDMDAPRSHGGVTQLHLKVIGGLDGAAGISRFLGAVGSFLTHLQLEISAEVGMEWLLAACPRLESLRIYGPVIRATSFLEVYRTSTAKIFEIDCCFDDLSMIARELEDRGTRLAQTLERLAYTSPLDYESYDEDAHANAVAKMLTENFCLQFVQLTLPQGVYAQNKSNLERHHNEVLPGIGAPLSLQCRLALLSVFASSHQSLERQSKREKSEANEALILTSFPMDRHLFSVIFDFAAERVRRQVFVQPSMSWWG